MAQPAQRRKAGAEKSMVRHEKNEMERQEARHKYESGGTVRNMVVLVREIR